MQEPLQTKNHNVILSQNALFAYCNMSALTRISGRGYSWLYLYVAVSDVRGTPPISEMWTGNELVPLLSLSC